MKLINIFAAAALWQSAFGFNFIDMEQKRKSLQLSSTLKDGDSRREFFGKAGAAAFSLSSGLSLEVLAPLPANAVGGLDKVNAQLKAYGLPLTSKPPSGLNPLLEVYGKGKNRFPLLVLMNHPITWVVTLPSNDVNGEDGTIQAGEYAKGDTATFFVYEEPGHVNNFASAGKDLYEKAIIKSISQKGNNIYQDFKITKVVPQDPNDYGGKEYVICDFRYTLLTGAGFEVDRRGVASLTSEGSAVEVLWTASTRERYKKTEPTLRDIAASFRVYADGLNFSSDLKNYDSVV
ncbi:unnamed protein product [Cylindrotheca closterium]|uniref:Uncharacterized protein n=1 Tax=Cylindrotheca closterium TaxID=2856 RepID=A0AAD2G7J5_9STRA|nr:unnamed protein product [Cylindrotheca closterium]